MSKKIKLRGGQLKKRRLIAGRPGAPSRKGWLQQALALHQAGRLPQSESLYRQILAAEPNNADALHGLGMLFQQAGKPEVAIDLISKAVCLRPEYVEALNNLAVILFGRGRLEEAGVYFQRLLALQPEYAEGHYLLGVLLQKRNKRDEAVVSFRRALSLKPDFPEAHHDLGITLQESGKPDEAADSYRRALTLKPDYAAAHNNLGSILKRQGKLNEAADSFRQAVAAKPAYAKAHYNLAVVLHEQGKLEEAAAIFRRTLSLNPAYVEAHYHLGNCLHSQGKLVEAMAGYHRAISLKPDYIEAYTGLGLALQEQGRLDEAADSYRRALTLQPDYAEVYNNLGNVLKDQGKLTEAVDTYHQALTLKPDYTNALGNLLFCLNFFPDLSPSHYLEQARRFGQMATAKAKNRFSEWMCEPQPKRLRIGLVSGDFRKHPVGFFLENFLANLDSARIELVAYPTFGGEDELTARIRPFFAAWKPLQGMQDETAANLVHESGVHILIDLSGHTAHNRLPVFAWKPAPVQVTWLGYFASTGIAEMDYLLADPVSVPEGDRKHYTEQVWNLPDTRFCFSPPDCEELQVNRLPALANGYVTFGCFQKTAKINDGVLAAWGRIFEKLPTAMLRLQNLQLNSPGLKEELQRRFAQKGIAPERIVFADPASRRDYLAAHSQVDIVLDTFPFPGGTTTCEALWMGVPTLTIAGKSMLARQGASILSCAGLDDWIAEDEDDYVAKGAMHAADTENLARLRAGLRRQVLASPLFAGRPFSRNFEAAMWGMWRSWQKNR